MQRLLLVLLLAMLAPACAATARHIRGPDGEDDWLSISCRRSEANCYERAAQECPAGYSIADNRAAYGSASFGSESGTVSGRATALGGFSGSYSGSASSVSVPIYHGEMIIKCSSGGASAAVAQEEEEERAVSDDRGPDLHLCGAAFGHIEDLADLWVEWFRGEGLDRAPIRSAFDSVCGSLPEDAQLCLNPAYAKGHKGTCLASIGALPLRTKQKLDRLFLRGPGAAQLGAAPSVPSAPAANSARVPQGSGSAGSGGLSAADLDLLRRCQAPDSSGCRLLCASEGPAAGLACGVLASRLYDGRRDLPSDLTEYFGLLRRSCALGYARACETLRENDKVFRQSCALGNARDCRTLQEDERVLGSARPAP